MYAAMQKMFTGQSSTQEEISHTERKLNNYHFEIQTLD